MKLNAGVVGLGMGYHHVKQLLVHPKVNLVGVADIDPDRREMIRKNHEAVPVFASVEEMLKKGKPDMVCVATPNRYHRAVALEAFAAGAHVFCEKPMAMNAGEAEDMLEASRNAGRRLMINFSFRFTEQSWALKQEIDSGLAGDIYFGRTVWHRRRGFPLGKNNWFVQKASAGGGPLIDLGVHRLDLALWLMGYPKPVYVLGATYDHLARDFARNAQVPITVEDLAAAFITFENGASLVLEASWAGNIAEREYMETRLLGTKAGLVQRNIEEGYQFQAEIYVERDGRQYDMKLHPPVPGVKGSVHHFVDSIIEDKPHTATGEEGLTVMKLLDAVYRSAETRAPVRIDT